VWLEDDVKYSDEDDNDGGDDKMECSAPAVKKVTTSGARGSHGGRHGSQEEVEEAEEEALLIRSDRGKSGFKGVYLHLGKYKSSCDTPPCRGKSLGSRLDTPEQAARRYLQHQQHEHAAELSKPLVAKLGVIGHAVTTGKGKKRKQQPQQISEIERVSGQLPAPNEPEPFMVQCKQEFIEEAVDHTAFQQVISAVEAVIRCGICAGIIQQASTVSGCGHTFCRGCIQEAVRVKGCCPECRQPAWHRDIRDARRLTGVMAELDGFKNCEGWTKLSEPGIIGRGYW
jgi:hypothetical protein